MVKKNYLRFMKKGPMTEADWSRHTAWLENNAKKRRRNSKSHLSCFRKRSSIKYIRESKKVPLNKLLNRLKGLSKPRVVATKIPLEEIPRVKRSALRFRATRRLKSLSVPRIVTEKYISRPRPPSPLPQKKCFVSRRALLYKLTEKTDQLAKPRKVRSFSYDEELKSKPMTKEQWRMHKKWLVERANPKALLEPNPNPNLIRKHKPIEQLLPRLESLAYPRIYKVEKPKENGVKKSALNAEASPTIIKLATPKIDFTMIENQIRLHEKCRKEEDPIKSPIINKGKKTINL